MLAHFPLLCSSCLFLTKDTDLDVSFPCVACLFACGHACVRAYIRSCMHARMWVCIRNYFDVVAFAAAVFAVAVGKTQ